jgi:hypothetical protein
MLVASMGAIVLRLRPTVIGAAMVLGPIFVGYLPCSAGSGTLPIG